MRSRRLFAASLCLAWSFPAGAFAADAAREAVIAAKGSSAGTLACSGCHGASGEGQAEAGIPRLAGLPEAYLDAQLHAFAVGTRDNAVMGPMAKQLDDSTMADVAAYYASAKPPTAGASTVSGDASLVAAGGHLALQGDWGRDLPPCASCHGKRGLGVGAAFPPLAGQSATYIANELRDWRKGSRHDDPHGLMHAVAARLDDASIAAVAAYYATLSPAVPAHPTETKP